MSADSSPPTYCWSLNGEEYYGNFDSRESARYSALDDCDGEPGTYATVYTARMVPTSNLIPDRAEYLVERMIEELDESLGEEISSDGDPIIELEEKDQKALADLVASFIVEHAHFNRYGVEDVEQTQELIVE